MHLTLIVAIGWIYVTLLMSLTQDTVLAGIFTFLFYGLVPVGIVVYLFTTPVRKRRRRALEEAAEKERRSGSEQDAPSRSDGSPANDH